MLDNLSNIEDKESTQFSRAYLKLVTYLETVKLQEKGKFGEKSFLAALIAHGSPELKKDAEVAETRVNEKLQEILRLRARVTRQEALLDKQGKQILMLNDQVSKQKKEIELHKEKLVDADKKLKKVTKDLHTHSQRLQKLKEEQARQKEEKESDKSHKHELIDINAGLKQSLKESFDSVAKLEKEKANLLSDNKSLQIVAERLKTDNANLDQAKKIQKEKASQWEKAFESLLEAFNNLLKKDKKVPLPLDVKKGPEATIKTAEEVVAAISQREEPTKGAGIFSPRK